MLMLLQCVICSLSELFITWPCSSIWLPWAITVPPSHFTFKSLDYISCPSFSFEFIFTNILFFFFNLSTKLNLLLSGWSSWRLIRMLNPKNCRLQEQMIIFFTGLASTHCRGCKICRRLLLVYSAIPVMRVGLTGYLYVFECWCSTVIHNLCLFCTFPTQFVVKLFRPHLSHTLPSRGSCATARLPLIPFFLIFSPKVLMVCPSVPNPALWLGPEKSSSRSGRHTWQLSCAPASPPWHLAGYVFSAVTKAVSSGVTLLTDIKKFLWHAHKHTDTHTGKHGRWPRRPKCTWKHRGSLSEMKLKFQTRLGLCYPPVKTD